MKKDNRKLYVLNVRENKERILFEYEDEHTAKLQMTILGRKQKTGEGIICVVKAHLNENGEIDNRYREDIAVYDGWLARVLAEN